MEKGTYKFSLMKNTEFTIEKGFEYQRADLAFWKKRLNAEAYEYLVEETHKLSSPSLNGGKIFKDGYDVPRGSTLMEIVLNWKKS